MYRNIKGLIVEVFSCLDKHLHCKPSLYGVEVKVLNQAVKRNIERFPEDFMFQLTEFEFENLRSQIVTANVAWSKKRFFPHVFTEQGVAMLSSVLRSKQAIEVNVLIMRAFVEMRGFLISNATVFEKFHRIDQKFLEHDENFNKLFNSFWYFFFGWMPKKKYIHQRWQKKQLKVIVLGAATHKTAKDSCF